MAVEPARDARRVQLGTPRDPSPPGAGSRSSSRWSSCSRRPRRRTPRCCRPIRRTAASTTRRRRRSRSGSTSRSRSRSAASACTTATATRVVTGSPEHPDGTQSEVVRSSLPKLDDGTYVVTWRVISADSHPVEGAYTFQVGSKATLSKNAKGVRQLAAGHDRRQPDRRRRLRHRPCACCSPGIALLIGGVGVPRRGLAHAVATTAAAARLVWAGWITVARHDRLRHRARGRVRRRASRSTTCSTPRCSATCSTRATGTSRSVRLALLVLAVPLLRVLLHRRPAAEHPLRLVVEGRARSLVGAGHRGHARHRRSRGRPASRPGSPSRPTSCTSRRWRAGSAASSCSVSRCCRDATSTSCARVLPRYSALALGRDRRVGRHRARTRRGARSAASTRSRAPTTGKLLIAKLVAFAALIVAAAFSREVVNRRFRDVPSDDEEFATGRRPGARRRRRHGGRRGRPPRAVPAATSAVGGGGVATEAGGDRRSTTTTTGTSDPTTRKRCARLRRSVWVEVAVAGGDPLDHRDAGERGTGARAVERSRCRSR